MTAAENNWWEGRESLQEFARRVSEKYGAPCAIQILRDFFETCGGLRVRVPTIFDLERLERDEKIRRLFNGANVPELALRFGLSEQQIRTIVKKCAGSWLEF